MTDSPSIPLSHSLNHPVSSLLTHHIPHPNISRSNLYTPHSSSHLSAPRPTPHLPPPPTSVPNHNPLHHRRHLIPSPQSSHNFNQPNFTSQQLRPTQFPRTSTPAPAPTHVNTSYQLTNSHIPAFPSVLSTQSTLPRPLCNPVPNPIPNSTSTLHHPLDLTHHQKCLQSTQEHRRPEVTAQPNKYRRLDPTTHISTVRHTDQVPAALLNPPLLSVIKTPYETVDSFIRSTSTRDDGYSTGSRETAAAPDGLEDDHDIETPYTCVHCAARFADKEQRKNHIKTAHEKPFVCTSCNSRFTRKFDLEKHSLTVHEGMRPFHCDICNACFGQKHHLVRHKKAVHAKARDFACDACSSRFARKEHLGNHKRAVHEKHKPYMCSLCDVQYYERRALRRHLEQVHNVKSSRASVFVEWQPNGSGSAPSIHELVQM